MKDFFKWVFNDRQHRNRIILSTLLTIVFFATALKDTSNSVWSLIFLSTTGTFYILNWVMICKLYNKNK